MRSNKYPITHHYQPTNNTCGYAALAMFLSHYGYEYTPEQLVDKVPQPTDDKGEPVGSVTAQLVEWCQSEGLQAHMYASDALVLDLSWQNKTGHEIVERLGQIRDVRDAQVMSSHWKDVYVDAYIAMLQKGAKLSIVPFIKMQLLYDLLEKGPVYVNINSTANGGIGRTVNPGLRQKELEDVKGKVSNHSVVIYGHDEQRNFLVADPWDGMVEIEPEQMVLVIEAAQIECDNQCFVIEKEG